MAVRAISVAGHKVGLNGLDEALTSLSPEWTTRDDAALGAELVARLAGENYIPASARAAYAAALAREYRLAQGQPVAPAPSAGLEVKVLGLGCARCHQLSGKMMNLLAALDLPGAVEHVQDAREIASYGVMGSPALVINGQVKAVGNVPADSQLRQWLLAAAGREA